MKPKIRAQVKSRFYYYFWGCATIAVVAGQMYVGLGYRHMVQSVDRLTAVTIASKLKLAHPGQLFDK